MKTTKQIIAAMGFASLLFAPLAQANPGRGDVGVRLVGDGFRVSASKIDFGQIIPDEVASSVLSITCTGSGDNFTATAERSNFDSRISGVPRCGVVKVAAGSEQIVFTLEAVVTALTGEGDDIAPTLSFYLSDNSRNLGGLETVRPGPAAAAGGRTIAASASEVFKVAGSITVAARQEPGTYTGTYTVTARIVTPSP